MKEQKRNPKLSPILVCVNAATTHSVEEQKDTGVCDGSGDWSLWLVLRVMNIVWLSCGSPRRLPLGYCSALGEEMLWDWCSLKSAWCRWYSVTEGAEPAQRAEALLVWYLFSAAGGKLIGTVNRKKSSFFPPPVFQFHTSLFP